MCSLITAFPLAVELTPVENGVPTEARCHIPLTQDDAMRLALLIAEHAEKFGWPIPEGSISQRTIQ